MGSAKLFATVDFDASIVLIKDNKKTTRKGGFLIGKVGFERFNVTVRWTVTREGLAERNYDFCAAEMKRIPAAPLVGIGTEAAAILLTKDNNIQPRGGVWVFLLGRRDSNNSIGMTAEKVREMICKPR